MKKIIYMMLLFSVLFVAGCGKKKKSDKEIQTTVDTVAVEVIEVQPQVFSEYGEYFGEISAIEEASLVCLAGGKVESVSAREGAYVKAGQSLAKINAQKAINAFETAKLNEKIASDNYERMKKHLEEGNASQLAVDQAHLGWLNSKSALLDANRIRKSALCITPISGTVVSRYIEPHQETGPGTPTFTVSKLHRLKINFGIPEGEMMGVKEGNTAEITVSVYPEKTWEGKIKRLSRQANKRMRTFAAEIHLRNPDRLLKPGLTAHIRLLRQTLKDQIVLPTGSIQTRGDEHYVMLEMKNHAVKRQVELGTSNETHTQIVSGLKPGDRLILKGGSQVAEGTPVKILQ